MNIIINTLKIDEENEMSQKLFRVRPPKSRVSRVSGSKNFWGQILRVLNNVKFVNLSVSYYRLIHPLSQKYA